MYHKVFTRTWWKHNASWPDGREPQPGRKYTIATHKTQAEAIEICKEYNETHDPGFLSKKAEFEEM